MNKLSSNYLIIVVFLLSLPFVVVENRDNKSYVNENTVVNIPESAIETTTTRSTTSSTTTTTLTSSTTTTVFKGEVTVKLTCNNVVSTNNETAYANLEVEIENTTNKIFRSRIEVKPGSRVINLMPVDKGIRTTQIQKFEYDIINLTSNGRGYFAAYLYEEDSDKVLDYCFFDRQVPNTTITSTTTTSTTMPNNDENYGNTIFKTREDYHKHILDLNFIDGYRGYEGDFVINNGWDGKNWDCSPTNNARGCRSFYEFFPWVSGLNFSLPNSGGNRAFGEIDITIPNDHQILSVGVDLVACRSRDLNCARSNEGEYLVHLSNFNYTFRNFKDLPEFYIDLVGREKTIGVDQSFFYPGYYYFLKSFTISFIDESDPLLWQGTLDFRVVPGVGTYVWQVGWDGPYNVGWLNPSYNFIYASLDTYQNTPYFSP